MWRTLLQIPIILPLTYQYWLESIEMWINYMLWASLLYINIGLPVAEQKYVSPHYWQAFCTCGGRLSNNTAIGHRLSVWVICDPPGIATSQWMMVRVIGLYEYSMRSELEGSSTSLANCKFAVRENFHLPLVSQVQPSLPQKRKSLYILGGMLHHNNGNKNST